LCQRSRLRDQTVFDILKLAFEYHCTRDGECGHFILWGEAQALPRALRSTIASNIHAEDRAFGRDEKSVRIRCHARWISRISLSGIDSPEDDEVTAITHFSQRGSRSPATLRHKELVRDCGRSERIQRSAKLISDRHSLALRFTRQFRCEVDEHSICTREQGGAFVEGVIHCDLASANTRDARYVPLAEPRNTEWACIASFENAAFPSNDFDVVASDATSKAGRTADDACGISHAVLDDCRFMAE
jgi:hypothetical protein